jgi:hypothetical protein
MNARRKQKLDIEAAAWTPQELLDLLYAWDDLSVYRRHLEDAKARGHAAAVEAAERGIAEIGELTALEALKGAWRLARVVSDWRDRLVAEARAAGASWAQIGWALGLTRQAAWAMYHAEGDADSDDQPAP